VTTPLEHPSLMKPLKEAYLDGLIELSILQISPEGDLVFGPEDFAGADVIFATAAHNETGRIVNLSAIAALVQSHTILISDAAQACGRLGPLPERIDAMVVSAHKMGGVVGAGAMVIRGNARNLPAPWAGGGQESGLRPGTEALPLLAAFGAACRDIEEIRDAHQALASHRDSIEQKLLSAWPFARVIAGRGPRIPNTSAIMLEGVDGEALRIAIDTTLVCVGFGSACSALAPEPSPALLAMGLTSQQARATIRISLFPGTSRGEVDEALGRIVPAVLRFKT
jgi:cysteine desulfurase